MNKQTSHLVTVDVRSRYLPEQSEPEDDRYAFAYTITIKNAGETPTQLTHRHWVITDANGKVEEVHGEGVIGEQPRLNPGDQFEYTSGAIIETPVGAMQGYYDMKGDDGEHFKAPITPFTLSVPGSLH